ncbi:MAG TPA: cytochrome c biogenesis protein CcsA [Candidatus Hydrogenedentes bacterium]|mgnify:CR=1 FL=1|nr:cytochrome c biogenesis protein CcsA [Candidatus Hydrogenedentota bacterium]HOL77164.1 cytochrome c biogenesis protein CcsA [Candidatus Hydrogenedentota bacterium]HPO85897.1 cytochrome c biogenesis protein CcsA [Candidatus Hydrogenedentota bacterium]
MHNVVTILAWVGCAGYVVAAGYALYFLRTGRQSLLRPTALGLFTGGFSLLGALVLRGFISHRLPLTGARDALSLLIILATAAALPVARRPRAASLLCFHAPLLALLSLITIFLTSDTLATPAHQLRSMPLILHVGVAFLAYAFFLSGGLTSAAYVIQARRIKSHSEAGFFQYLPSLEELDQSLWSSITKGYVLFTATLFIGWAWAWAERNLLGDKWYLAPKVLLSLVMVLFYAVCFHARRRGWLRGPQLAYWVLMGFCLFFGLYLVLELTGLRTYYFWGNAQ